MTVQFSDIALAHYRLARYLTPTPIESAPGLGERVSLKLENTNRTHSFKVRGALNAMLALSDEQRERGIVTASSGNHAQGIAYAANLIGVRARIVMPRHTARRKLSGVLRYGGQAILHGDLYDEAEAEARRLEHDEGLTFISPYNDPNVIAGAGTVGLEIAESVPSVRRVIVPIGGGGLISGIGIAIKHLCPQAEVIGVNARSGMAMYGQLYGVEVHDTHETLADALPGEIEHNSITIDLARQYVDQVVVVEEEDIAAAMKFMVSDHGWIVEGGGAVGVAALMSGVIPAAGRETMVVISGGNVDVETLNGVLSRRG